MKNLSVFILAIFVLSSVHSMAGSPVQIATVGKTLREQNIEKMNAYLNESDRLQRAIVEQTASFGQLGNQDEKLARSATLLGLVDSYRSVVALSIEVSEPKTLTIPFTIRDGVKNSIQSINKSFEGFEYKFGYHALKATGGGFVDTVSDQDLKSFNLLSDEITFIQHTVRKMLKASIALETGIGIMLMP